MSKVSQKMTFGLTALIAGALLALGSMAWAYANGQLPPEAMPTTDDLWPLFLSLIGLNLVIFGTVTLSINAQGWVIEGIEQSSKGLGLGSHGTMDGE